jgi:PmbA protein
MDIVKKALRLGADDVVVESPKGKFNQVKFANNSITVSQSWDIFRYNIFLTLKNRIVNTTIYDVSKKSIEKTIKSLVKAAKLIKPNNDYFGIAKGPFRYKPVGELYDKKIENISGIDIVESTVNSALQYSKKTAGVFYSGLHERNIETSSNISASEKTTSISISIRAFNKKDESGHSISCSRVLNKFNPEAAGEKAGQIAESAKKPHRGEQGNFDIIFDPFAIANLLSVIGRFSSSFAVDSGFSFLRDKLGKRIGSRIVNLIDNGRINNGFNSYAFDDEGVPTKTTLIIDKGILKTYLHNTSTARKHKTKTTGNAGLIAPEPTNIILKPGKYSKENLFKNIKNGLYITNIWYTRFQNYLTGDFSTIPRDGIFLIKNGEVVRSLKGIRISDNLQRILLNIIKISNKPEWIQGWESENPVFTPYVLVKNVNVTLPTM